MLVQNELLGKSITLTPTTNVVKGEMCYFTPTSKEVVTVNRIVCIDSDVNILDDLYVAATSMSFVGLCSSETWILFATPSQIVALHRPTRTTNVVLTPPTNVMDMVMSPNGDEVMGVLWGGQCFQLTLTSNVWSLKSYFGPSKFWSGVTYYKDTDTCLATVSNDAAGWCYKFIRDRGVWVASVLNTGSRPMTGIAANKAGDILTCEYGAYPIGVCRAWGVTTTGSLSETQFIPNARGVARNWTSIRLGWETEVCAALEYSIPSSYSGLYLIQKVGTRWLEASGVSNTGNFGKTLYTGLAIDKVGNIYAGRYYDNVGGSPAIGVCLLRKHPILSEIVVAKQDIAKGEFGEFVYMGVARV